ncbi:MAG: sugar phosphate isomerase/epimerase [Candidatus Hydrogenedentes bacterium]|nr:sugar phosphate isomerase/epimerase [Candidatus Hydrogenedentota bacterium]
MRKAMGMWLVIGVMLVTGVVMAEEARLADGSPTAEAMGWRLGCQAYSFNRFTFFEAVDKTAAVGLKWIEAYPGQRLSKDLPETVVFDHNMSADVRKQVLDYLASKGVKLSAYGVVNLPKEEAESRKVFDFAKAMGIGIIVSEPLPSSLPMIDNLCKEYGIKVAIHNHPKPSKYYDYKTLLDAVKSVSPNIGACCDTGHWPRSGIDPVEAVKAVGDASRIIEFHFKDLNEFGNRDAHDVIWGTGVCNVKEILSYLKQKGIQAHFSIEYEHNWDNSLPEIAECVKAFEAMAKELSGK